MMLMMILIILVIICVLSCVALLPCELGMPGSFSSVLSYAGGVDTFLIHLENLPK